MYVCDFEHLCCAKFRIEKCEDTESVVQKKRQRKVMLIAGTCAERTVQTSRGAVLGGGLYAN